MKKICFLLICLTLLTATKEENPAFWDANTPLSTIFAYLGEQPPEHLPPAEKRIPGIVSIGKTLFTKGYVVKPGKEKTKRQSKFFTCTDCHNTEIEGPDLRVSDPEKCFPYIWEQGLPHVQGTTIKGIVNRTSWYNGDYDKKYGELVKPARGKLKEAIQLCARECSQGRELTQEELDGMIAYFWSLEYTLKDLKFSDDDYIRLREEAKEKEKHKELVAWLKTFYLQAAPASFGDPPKDFTAGYELKGNSERGEQIYKLSCMHCHAPGRIVKFPYVFKYSSNTFGHLTKYFTQDHDFSPYNAIRKGTDPGKRKGLYMPNFTLEKMSNQQIEDLREYITSYQEKEN
jgi:mono/diheme cytochrome c family protein